MKIDLIRDLAQRNDAKILFVVVDGLGGLPKNGVGKTELQVAKLPNLTKLAKESACGLTNPMGYGIIPGSEHGHLALFGYDPLQYNPGRGVLEAAGIGFPLRRGDVTARGNFCRVSDDGVIEDRRAGRISTDTCEALCELLKDIDVGDVTFLVDPVREHRFLLVARGEDLDERVTETDPGREGIKPLAAAPLNPAARRTAELVNKFVQAAREKLKGRSGANMILLRGFSSLPNLPRMDEVYKLKAAAIASYPMNRGLAKILGMDVPETGPSLDEQLETLRQNWQNYDFFFFHYKRPDTAGEDGDFDGKVNALEQFDKVIPAFLQLQPSPAVLVISGDHSTPSVLRAHSSHPVPFLLHSEWGRHDELEGFDEVECARGSLGVFPATEVMAIVMSESHKLAKFPPKVSPEAAPV